MNQHAPFPPFARADWFAAQLKPNCLHIAERNLLRQGFEVFCPRVRLTRRGNGGFRTAPVPLFPGYVFVAVDPLKGGWRTINSTSGVTRLVTVNGKPGLVPRPVIEALRARCDGDDLMQPMHEFKAGDRVRIVAGPFADFVATVDSIDPERRLWVLFDLMGRATRAALDRDTVVPG